MALRIGLGQLAPLRKVGIDAGADEVAGGEAETGGKAETGGEADGDVKEEGAGGAGKATD